MIQKYELDPPKKITDRSLNLSDYTDMQCNMGLYLTCISLVSAVMISCVEEKYVNHQDHNESKKMREKTETVTFKVA